MGKSESEKTSDCVAGRSSPSFFHFSFSPASEAAVRRAAACCGDRRVRAYGGVVVFGNGGRR